MVTAQRREQRLQDVPISMTAFDAEAIERYPLIDVGDYFDRTANVSFNSAGGPASTPQCVGHRGRGQVDIRHSPVLHGLAGPAGQRPDSHSKSVGTANAASASSPGGELDLDFLATDNLQLSLVVGYNDAKFDDYPKRGRVHRRVARPCSRSQW